MWGIATRESGSMTAEILWILGESGHAREVEAIARAIDPGSKRWGRLRLVGAAAEERLLVVGGDTALGMGSPTIRARVSARFGHLPQVRWPVLVHPRAQIGPNVHLADGVTVAPGVTVTVDVRIGEWSMVNTCATVSHDVRIGRHCLVNPRATISGGVVIEDEVLVGAGAVVLEGRRLGRGSTVGAGAVVTANVLPGTTVVGVPARTLPRKDEE